MTRCQCCDLDIRSCGKALEQRQRADAARRAGELTARGYIRAAYPGTCATCREPFGSGAYITSTVGGAGWIAECCA